MFIVEKQRQAKTLPACSLLTDSAMSPWLSNPWTVSGVFQKEQGVRKYLVGGVCVRVRYPELQKGGVWKEEIQVI